MSEETRMIVGTLLAGVAVLAVLWFAAIAPKRSEQAEARASVTVQETRLAGAKAEVVSEEAARKQFPGLMAELKRLDVAVPGRGAIADLLRELQRRARVSGGNLRLVSLKTGGGAPAGGAVSASPGATPGPGGLAALPFTFEYDGEFSELLHILRAVRKSVTVRSSGDVAIGGRLLTIDGLTFKRPDAGGSRTKVTVNATAYIAPEGVTSPQPPAAAPTQGAE